MVDKHEFSVERLRRDYFKKILELQELLELNFTISLNLEYNFIEQIFIVD